MSNYVQLKVGDVDKTALQLGSYRYIAGADGFSPVVDIADLPDGGHQITITDKYGPHTFVVLDGENGQDGASGADGYSPTIDLEPVTIGAGVLIEDESGMNWYLPEGGGNDGDIVLEDLDGGIWHIPSGSVSEGAVTVADESGDTWYIPLYEGTRSGYKITVTDKNGAKVFYLWDGLNEGGGGSLPDGGTNGQYLVRDTTAPGGARWADLPVYEPTESTWSVTPLVGAATTLNTAGNYLDRDIVVQAIPYAEVSNQTGGKTATIGG